MIEFYKNRTILIDEPIWVYRNLRKSGGPWYSIMQRGIVVAHAREVNLRNCKFVVRNQGRVRVIKSGVKNVHAFVVGLFVQSKFVGEPVPGRYNPRTMTTFCILDSNTNCWSPITNAVAAFLGPVGLLVTQPSINSGNPAIFL